MLKRRLKNINYFFNITIDYFTCILLKNQKVKKKFLPCFKYGNLTLVLLLIY